MYTLKTTKFCLAHVKQNDLVFFNASWKHKGKDFRTEFNLELFDAG